MSTPSTGSAQRSCCRTSTEAERWGLASWRPGPPPEGALPACRSAQRLFCTSAGFAWLRSALEFSICAKSLHALPSIIKLNLPRCRYGQAANSIGNWWQLRSQPGHQVGNEESGGALYRRYSRGCRRGTICRIWVACLKCMLCIFDLSVEL